MSEWKGRCRAIKERRRPGIERCLHDKDRESEEDSEKIRKKNQKQKVRCRKSCDAPVHASRQHFCCAGQFQRQQVRLDGGDVETAAYGQRIGIDGIETHCVQQLRTVFVERG